MPGDNVTVDVELIVPIAMEEKLRFAIREGGRTVGAGIVARDQGIIDAASRSKERAVLGLPFFVFHHDGGSSPRLVFAHFRPASIGRQTRSRQAMVKGFSRLLFLAASLALGVCLVTMRRGPPVRRTARDTRRGADALRRRAQQRAGLRADLPGMDFGRRRDIRQNAGLN